MAALDESPLRTSHVLYLLSHSSEASPAPPEVLRLLGLLDSQEYGNAPIAELFKAASFDKAERSAFSKYHVASRLVARELGFKAQEHGIVINGRVRTTLAAPCAWLIRNRAQVIGPIAPAAFEAADFVTLATYEFSKRVKPVVEALHEVAPEVVQSDKYVLPYVAHMLLIWP